MEPKLQSIVIDTSFFYFRFFQCDLLTMLKILSKNSKIQIHKNLFVKGSKCFLPEILEVSPCMMISQDNLLGQGWTTLSTFESLETLYWLK